MLRELKISNLALISELHIEFGSGLSVLTGETGAGKSIILQSINLLYGEQAARSWVRTGADSAVIEALCECQEGSPVRSLLAEHDFGTDEIVILKRVVSAKGSSRYYINNSMATGRIVSEVAENLICVASQHDHQQLLAPAFQLDLVDAFGDLLGGRQELAATHDRWSACLNEFKELQTKENDKEQHRDFLAFQCREIEDAAIEIGEEDRLEQEKVLLRSGEELSRLGGSSYELLGGQVSEAVSEVRNNLDRMASLDNSLAGLAEDAASAGYLLEETLHQLRSYLDNIPSDPEQLDTVTARIDLLQKMKRKYGPSLEEVLAFADQAAQELKELADMDQRLGNLAAELANLEKDLIEKARNLSRARKEAAAKLGEAVQQELQMLCLENSRFAIDFGEDVELMLENMTRKGWDNPEFIFSANQGEELKPIAKVASGGELSRLMLALKCILARHDQVETVIFDEIDAGISGKTAEAVARKIRELSGHHQVVCITHLPQIAAAAGEHFTVAKKVADARTHTSISLLSDETRIDELARMLDGDSVTAKTRAYAGELIEKNR